MLFGFWCPIVHTEVHMLRRTFRRLKMVFLDNRISVPTFLICVAGIVYAMSFVAQCLLVDNPVRTIRLAVSTDAEVRAETSVVSNAFQINVEDNEWQTLYRNRQEGSHPIIVVRHNGIESWLPCFAGILHRSFVEKPIFAGARVQSFWKVGIVEKVSVNEYRVTASKDWAVFMTALCAIVLSVIIASYIYVECENGWSRSWNRSLHHAI